MSKCIICGCEIIPTNMDSEIYGCDGDQIHIKCKDKLSDHYDKINNMTDMEFKNWMMGGDM